MSAEIEYTLSIIKPDATQHVLAINQMIQDERLKILISKSIHLTQQQAENFYAEHRGKGFYDGLVKFMSSAPVIVQVLEGSNAIRRYRDLMGATHPKEAKEGTIRYRFGNKENMTENAVHGSDGTKSAKREIDFYFTDFADHLYRLKDGFSV